MRISLVFATFLFVVSSHAQVNDVCDDALPLTVDASCIQVTTELLNATESLPPILCNGYTSSAANDAWFTFTALGPYTRLRTGGTSLDLVLEAFSGGCGVLTSEGCSDAFPINGTEELQIATVPGNSYHVRVYAWNYAIPPTNQEMWICALPGTPPPVNDLCASITPVPLAPGDGLQFSGTTVGATITNDYVQSSPLNWAGPCVWHAFELQGCVSSLSVAYCGTSPTFQNTFVVLALSCPADSLRYAVNWDQVSCSEPNVTFRMDTLQAGTYWLPVLWDQAAANGPYQIEVSTVACPVGVGELSGQDMVVAGQWDPTSSSYLLRLNAPSTGGEVRCMDLLGRELARQVWPAGSTEVSLRLPRIGAQGVHLIQFRDAQRDLVLRLVAW
ncbi:MAG: hypothetical protein JNM31_06730 [Flavobacteriales bacterium]|nr:hypothetical protein [Flavobacteriales bacterium]